MMPLCEACTQASGEPIPLTNDRIQQFGRDIIAAVQQQMTEGIVIQPSVYFLPGTLIPDSAPVLSIGDVVPVIVVVVCMQPTWL